jgi:outer membrane protein OmpA-like peptidoglycan-associated protein
MMRRFGALLAAASLAGCSFAPELRSTLPEASVATPALGRPAATLDAAQAPAAMRALREALAAALTGLPVQAREAGGDDVALVVEADASFEPQTAQLRTEALQIYAAIAASTKAQPAVVLHVVGFGDAEEGIEPSDSLGARRAASVEEELLRHGLFAGRLRAEGRSGPARIELRFKPVVQGREADAWMPPA